MPKFLEITPEIKNRIEASLGEEIDTSQFAVYETRTISTEPLSKSGFFDKARVSPGTLNEMGEFVNKEGSVLPLMILHKGDMLPSGRVFEAQLNNMPNGEVELRALFYIPRNSERKMGLINDIEAGLISEVSVGLLTTHAFCSECEFDFFGEDSDIMNLLTQTCENEHTIGDDGCHLRLVGLDTFAELSLVGRGAAKDAKIFSRAKGQMTKETLSRLAASGVPAEARLLTASYSMDNDNDKSSKPKINKGESKMPLEDKLAEVSAELGEAKAEFSQATETIEGLEEKITNYEAKLEEANSKIKDLEAEDGDTMTELKAKFEASEESVKNATDKLAVHVKAALVASGDAEAEAPEDLGEMIDLIEDKGLKLHQVVASDSTSDGTKTDAEKAEDKVVEARRKSNFKV